MRGAPTTGGNETGFRRADARPPLTPTLSRKGRSGILLSLLLLLLLAFPAVAVEPEEMLKDPVLETRAREISRNLRCLVCQNQSIDDSNAQLAKDLRVIVRERLTAGDSDTEVIAFVRARYGDFVLLKPPVTGATAVLWLAPAGILLLAGIGVLLFLRRRKSGPATPAPLTAAEKKRLDELGGGDAA